MMADYYVRASLLTAALCEATARLRRPVDRLRVLPGGLCLVSAGWRWTLLRGRRSAGSSDEGGPIPGGGGWSVEARGTERHSLSARCMQRAELLHAFISEVSGDLRVPIDELAMVRSGNRCRVRARFQRAMYKATWRPEDGWWEIDRITEGQASRRFWIWL